MRRKKQIYDNCIFWFQKKNAYKKIEEIDKKIYSEYEKIGNEINYISKLMNPIDET